MIPAARPWTRIVLGNAFMVVVLFPLCRRILADGPFDFTPGEVVWMVGTWVLVPRALVLRATWRQFRAKPWRPLPRPTPAEAEAFFVHPFVLSVILGLAVAANGDLIDPLRLRPSLHPLAAMALGFGFYLPLFLASVASGRRRLGNLRASRAFLAVMRRLLPRTRKGRSWITALLLLNPFTEELAYRGVLVVLLASLVGWVPAVVAGLAVCLAGHLYQGPRALPFHALFYVLALCMILSEGGMWAAFGLHLAGDVIPWMRVPFELRTLRRERAARAAQSPGPRSSAPRSPSRASGQ